MAKTLDRTDNARAGAQEMLALPHATLYQTPKNPYFAI